MHPFGGGGGWSGKPYHMIFFGGVERTVECPVQTTFGGPRNWDWSGRCLFRLRDMTESHQKKGGWGNGVPKTFWGRGFTVCSPPRSYSPPLLLSELGVAKGGKPRKVPRSTFLEASKKVVVTKRVFSLEETLKSLESLENGRILLCFQSLGVL